MIIGSRNMLCHHPYVRWKAERWIIDFTVSFRAISAVFFEQLRYAKCFMRHPIKTLSQFWQFFTVKFRRTRWFNKKHSCKLKECLKSSRPARSRISSIFSFGNMRTGALFLSCFPHSVFLAQKTNFNATLSFLLGSQPPWIYGGKISCFMVHVIVRHIRKI